MADVDLDRLAAAYDHRPESGTAQRMADVLEAARPGPGDLVLDVGGGRGRQAAVIAETAGCRVIVVDPSASMVHAAAARGLDVVRARVEALPFPGGSVDLALFHLSIHHGDWLQMLREAWRVVRRSGAVFVWTMAPADLRRSFLARWFPRVGEIDAGRFPSIHGLMDAIRALGGDPVAGELTEWVTRPAVEWVAAVRAGYVSTLHLLDPEEIEMGIRRFQAAHPDPQETIRYPLRFTSVSSVRPSVES